MRTYFYALVLLALMLVIDLFGLKGWYVWLPWLDIVSHLTAGMGLGLLFYSLIRSFFPNIQRKKFLIIMLVSIAGILWELMEIYYHLTGHPLWSILYYLDTIKDLFMDVFGAGLVAYFWVRH